MGTAADWRRKGVVGVVKAEEGVRAARERRQRSAVAATPMEKERDIFVAAAM